MTKLWVVLVAGMLVAVLSAQALAWEFSMTGEFELRYRYISRTGPNDLFGNANIAQSLGTAGTRTTIGLAGPVVNYAPYDPTLGAPGTTATVQVEGFSVMGSDAAFLEQRAEIYPDLRVNPAIRLRGTYSLQGNLNGPYVTNSQNWADNPLYTPWYMLESRGYANGRAAIAVGVWRHYWLSAQTPWGILVVGHRPAPFGLGHIADEKNVNTGVALFAPYGPLGFFLVIYKGPGVRYTDPGSVVGPDPGLTDPAAGNQLVALFTDQNLTRNVNFVAGFIYRNGPVEIGSAWRHIQHQGTHGTAWPAALAHSFRNDQNPDFFTFNSGFFLNTPALGPMYTGHQFVGWWINYIKYNNGRFFFNAEFNQEFEEVSRSGGRPISGTPYGWMVELGCLCGPAKVTLFHFLKTGEDRRGGIFNPVSAIGTFGGSQVNDKLQTFVGFSGCEIPLKPYTFLLGLYGGGNNNYGDYGEPSYGNFVAYAGRLDYAVAANLNVWGSYMYALRQSNTAARIGQFNGFTGPTLSGVVPRAATSAITPVPNVPDNWLGWEMDFGIDWKLLEGLTFKCQFAYWQPGPWFKWAYVDQSSFVTTTVGGVTANINPNRDIDPLIGVQCSVLTEF